MKNNLVRIVLRVTPEEKQKMTLSASKEDRTLTLWAIRALRGLSGASSFASPVAPPASPVAPESAYVPHVPVFAPSTLRPDGKPYELGYPSTLSDGTVFHSVAEWQSSPEYVARQARFAELDKAAGK